MKTATNVLHSKESAEWYTPKPIIESARKVLGRIDLDPASCWEAQINVEAYDYFSAESNGLKHPWNGNIFLNPPGGQVKEFWKKFVAEYLANRVKQAVWIGYSLEQLQTLQSVSSLCPLNFPICYPDRRISFLESPERKAKREAEGKKATGPTHANYICYIGPRVQMFIDEFRAYGFITYIGYPSATANFE
jgi:hypothetical protein